MGFEPTTSSLGMGGGCDLSSELAGTYDLGDPSLVSCLVSLRRNPALAEVVGTWESLPAAIQAGVLATVRAAAD
jgi:hypothetical protein